MPYLGNSPVAGDHVNNFKVLDDISSHTATFDGSSTDVVDTTNNTITINVDASGTSVQGSGSDADQLGGLIASVVQATIIDEQRAGGLLNR